MTNHKYRFGASGKPLASFFNTRKTKCFRLFPLKVNISASVFGKAIFRNKKPKSEQIEKLTTSFYVNEYYKFNREHNIVAFVGH
jgi:hypothetical protein